MCLYLSRVCFDTSLCRLHVVFLLLTCPSSSFYFLFLAANIRLSQQNAHKIIITAKEELYQIKIIQTKQQKNKHKNPIKKHHLFFAPSGHFVWTNVNISSKNAEETNQTMTNFHSHLVSYHMSLGSVIEKSFSKHMEKANIEAL